MSTDFGTVVHSFDHGTMRPWSYYLSSCVHFGLGALTVVLGPECSRLLAGGFYHLTNPGDNGLGLPLMYVIRPRVSALSARGARQAKLAFSWMSTLPRRALETGQACSACSAAL